MRKALKLPGLGAAVLALALTVPAPAWAGVCQWWPSLCSGPRHGGSNQVPEIDPGALRATLAVLAGGVIILLERRRRR